MRCDGLVDALFRSHGRPLEETLRSFMEARLGVDLRRVRIHTDRPAGAATTVLGARALTRGTDIYFAAGEYAPHTPAGLHLLAHELVHVIQQSNRTPMAGSPAYLGAPESAFEAEAYLVADAVLRGKPAPPITPDRSGSVRRALTILRPSAQVVVNNGNAKATVSATSDGKKFICNLTQGFNPSNVALSGPAFDAFGGVDVLADGPADVTAMEQGALRFGFIQVARMHFSGTFWAGRKDSEGSVGLIPSNPPAWPPGQRVSLDSEPRTNPFIHPLPGTPVVMRAVPQGGRLLVQVRNISMHDHPMHGAPVRLMNSATVTVNFLFHLKDRFEYFTTLVALDRQGTVTPLAHFRWEVDYDARFRWVGGNPRAVQMGKVTFDRVVQGEPADPAIRGMLLSPTPPHTNAIHADANRHSVTNKNPANLSENKRRFANVPPDFWT